MENVTTTFYSIAALTRDTLYPAHQG